MLSLPAWVGAGTRSGCAGGAAAAARDRRRFPGSLALLLRLLVRPIRLGLDGGICTGRRENPLPLSLRAEASRGAPAFAKLAGQLSRALVRVGPAEPFGA